MRFNLRLVAIFAGTLALGCSGGDNGNPGTDGPSTGADLAMVNSPPDLAVATLPGGYPAGPYGTTVGDTIQNFTFKGYWAPTQTTGLSNTLAYGDVTLDLARKSGAKFMTFWFAGFT